MLAIRCIRIAGVYLLIGMVMGIVTGATENATEQLLGFLRRD